jgi:hypothetical protein
MSLQPGSADLLASQAAREIARNRELFARYRMAEDAGVESQMAAARRDLALLRKHGPGAAPVWGRPSSASASSLGEAAAGVGDGPAEPSRRPGTVAGSGVEPRRGVTPPFPISSTSRGAAVGKGLAAAGLQAPSVPSLPPVSLFQSTFASIAAAARLHSDGAATASAVAAQQPASAASVQTVRGTRPGR